MQLQAAVQESAGLTAMAWKRVYRTMPYLNMMLIASQHSTEDIDRWLAVWDNIVKLATSAKALMRGSNQ